MNFASASFRAAAAALLAASSAASPVQGTTGPDGLDLLRARAPESTVLWVESSELEPLTRLGLEHPLAKLVLEEPLVQEGLQENGVNLPAQIQLAEAFLGESPFDLVHALTSGGVAVGMLSAEPDSEALFAMARGLDRELMEEALETVAGTLESIGVMRPMTPAERGELDRSVVLAWHLGDQGDSVVWTLEGTLVYAHRPEDLISCCQTKGRSQALTDARARMGKGDLPGGGAPLAGARPKSFGWIHLDALEAAGTLDELRAAALNPGTHFLLGPAATYLSQASTLGLDLSIVDGELRFRALGGQAELGAGLVSFRRAAPAPGPGDASLSQALGALGTAAEAILYRDLSALLHHRTELFSPRSQPELAEGLAGLALLVGGVDAIDELLPAIQPGLHLFSDPVDFGDRPTPAVLLPGLCLAATLKDPELNGGRLVNAFQSAITLANVEEAMAGRDGRRLALDSVEGVTLSYATLPPPSPGETVELRHNFAPACALVGDVFLVGTHHRQVRAAIREILENGGPIPGQDADAGPPGPWSPFDSLKIHGPALHELGVSQRDLLVMNAVLDDGKTVARAGQEADILLRALGSITSLRYETFAKVAPEAELLAQLTVRLRD